MPQHLVLFNQRYRTTVASSLGTELRANDRMLMQIDEDRLNENVYDGAYVDTEFPLDLDLIDVFNEIRCSRGKELSLDRSVTRAYYFALGLD